MNWTAQEEEILASNIDILEDSCVDRISSKPLGFNAPMGSC